MPKIQKMQGALWTSPTQRNRRELKPWHTVHVDLIRPYTVTAKQQQPAKKIVSTGELKLTCMTFIDPATGWVEIAEVPTYDLDEVKAGTKEYIDKTSTRISL
jgi:hypothetical protein